MTLQWPLDWDARITGASCEMCDSTRPEEDDYGSLIYSTSQVDAVLQRARIQRGYTLVIWRGRHVVEPYELADEESAHYWRAVQRVARALAQHYRPIKMNYETLGNTVPHLHTHLLPRYVQDPAPGRPFPLLPQDGSEERIPLDELRADSEALRALLAD
jgi:diadenosine tetraphosphate (Ap4A) HIT family hydrolase